jgi:hypothetical protein
VSLTAVCIPALVTILDAECFHFCSVLRDVTFEADSQLREIGERAFAACLSMSSIRIPARVDLLKRGSFGHCPMLAEISIERGSELRSIDSAVFATSEPKARRISRPNIIFEDLGSSVQLDAVFTGRFPKDASGHEPMSMDDDFLEGYSDCFPA